MFWSDAISFSVFISILSLVNCNDYESCRSDQCIGMPDGCLKTAKCQVLFKSGHVHDNQDVPIELVANVSIGSYVTAGLSLDTRMGDEIVLQCLALQTGQSGAQLSWNQSPPNYGTVIIRQPVEGIRVMNHTYTDGQLRCRWFIKAKANVIHDDTIVTHLDMTTNKFYILLASGSFQHDVHANYFKLEYHGVNRESSPYAYSLIQEHPIRKYVHHLNRSTIEDDYASDSRLNNSAHKVSQSNDTLDGENQQTVSSGRIVNLSISIIFAASLLSFLNVH